MKYFSSTLVSSSGWEVKKYFYILTGRLVLPLHQQRVLNISFM